MNRAKSVNIAAQNGSSIITQDEQGQKIMNVFWIYTALFTAVASGAAATAQTTINLDGDFVLRQLTMSGIDSTTGANLAFPYPGTLQITDSASNQTLFDQAQQFSNIVGDARLPFVLPVPRRFRAGGVITSNIVNGVSAHAVTYQVSFIGVKLLPL